MTPRLPIACVLVLTACQHADELVDTGPTMPAASTEPQRLIADDRRSINPGLGMIDRSPVEPGPLRVRVTAREDPPPPVDDVRAWFATLDETSRRLVRAVCREYLDDPCWGMLAPPGALAPIQRRLAALVDAGVESQAAQQFCVEQHPRRVCQTPLVVAWGGGPVALEAGPAAFAFEPGVPIHTDWPTAATPWIVLDRDGDGAITSGAELFGDHTPLHEGRSARHGFEALAALDANHDGVLDRRDPEFRHLQLWSDADRDRRSSPAELRPLADTIAELPLAFVRAPRCRHGNCEGERVEITWRATDGSLHRGAVIDVYLVERPKPGAPGGV